MMNVEKITFLVKQVRYQEVEISESAGFNKVSNPLEFISLIDAIKQNPIDYCEGDWADEDTEVLNLEVTEGLNHE